MAPVKPMGTDRNEKTKPGQTGFHQEYNQDPGPRQDLNPDAVTEDSVLPPAQRVSTPNSSAPKARKTARAKK